MSSFVEDVDIVILAVPIIAFEDVVGSLPSDIFRGKLVVEVCPLNVHPKSVLLRHFGPETDVMSTNPMFGPSVQDDPHTTGTWDGCPMVYEKVRISDVQRCQRFLHIFEEARCQMVEMTAEEHDASTADAEFVTHLTGRLLDRDLLPASPVRSKEYTALCDVADMTGGNSLDLFFGMFKFNSNAKNHITKLRENLANVERELAAKDAYLTASAEMKNSDRQRLLAETTLLLQEIAKNGGLGIPQMAKEAPTPSEITTSPEHDSSKQSFPPKKK
jgi:prephenate dehydrogenase